MDYKVKNYKKIVKLIYKKINLEDVLNRYGLEYIAYTGNQGREFRMNCPFPDHDDLDPSFSINERDGFYHCFSRCGGGDFVKFIKKMERLKTIKEAVEFLKEKTGIEVDDKAHIGQLDKQLQEINNFKFSELKSNKEEFETPNLKTVKLPQSYPAEDYYHIVKKRISDLGQIRKWEMRYCNHPESKWQQKYHGRLIIPIYFNGKLVSFAARDMLGRSDEWNIVKEDMRKRIRMGTITPEEVKELKKKEFRKILYPFDAPTRYIFFNWDLAIKNNEYVIIVEGIMDAIKLVEWGYNAIAALSYHLNDYRINLLKKHFKKVYISLDNDDKINVDGVRINPGQEAALKIKEQLKFFRVRCYNILLPFGKDPDECDRDEFHKCFLKSHTNIFSDDFLDFGRR